MVVVEIRPAVWEAAVTVAGWRDEMAAKKTEPDQWKVTAKWCAAEAKHGGPLESAWMERRRKCRPEGTI